MAERGARLLVADDNKVNRLLLARTLALQGHQVESAENGRIALEMLRRNGFDLLLLDIELSDMDGFQVLEHIAADTALRDVPGRTAAGRGACGARDDRDGPAAECRTRHRGRGRAGDRRRHHHR